MLRRGAWFLVATTVLALVAPALAQSADELEAEAKRLEARLAELKSSATAIESRFETEHGYELQVYAVQDLMTRLNDFVAPNLELKPAGHEFDEEHPQFGVSEEGPTFFGPDELVELVQSLAPAGVWEGQGSVVGTSRVLVVRAPAEVQERIAEMLRAVRRDLGRLVTVELHVVRARSLPSGPLTPAQTAKLLERLAATEGEGEVASAEVTGYAGQQLALFDGTQTAFVEDYDVEVAESSRIEDPIVGVVLHGLAADVRAMPRGSAGLVLLDVRADVSLPGTDHSRLDTPTGKVARGDQGLLEVRASVTIPDGGAIVLGGSTAGATLGTRTAVLARARIHSVEVAPRKRDRAAELRRRIDTLSRRVRGREEAAREHGPVFRTRLYAVNDLLFVPPDHAGPTLDLTPSGGGSLFDEGMEEDPLPYYELDTLQNLVVANVATGSWSELSSANIAPSSRNNLVITHTAGAHADVAALLHELRVGASRVVEVDVEVVRISDADRRALAAANGGAPVLSTEARAQLSTWIAEGRVRRIHTGRVLAQSGQRVALVDLARRSYVYDLDVEIARGIATPDPLVASLSEGVVVDVRPVATGDGTHVIVETRFQRTRLVGEMGSAETPIGKIETPRIRSTKVSATLAARSGGTIVLGGGLETKTSGELEGCLVLLTPRVIGVR